ncbi:MAG: hypothetical protein IPI88_11475 [Chitinophagaceae bacterium]|nr:hypothetical protein [Chitinophagaceae bacterium]
MRKSLLFNFYTTQISKHFKAAAVKKIQNAVKVALKRIYKAAIDYNAMTKKPPIKISGF